jgi:hypothetical protein
MPSKPVADAVEARLVANWHETPFIPYDTLAQPPDNAEAFVVIQYPVANAVRPVLGRVFWDEGAIRIVLNVQRGIGQAQGLLWSDMLKDIYRSVKFDGVETFVPDGPVVDDTIENGNWVEYSIVVPYRFEFVAAVYESISV